jgi:hypothetical protein
MNGGMSACQCEHGGVEENLHHPVKTLRAADMTSIDIEDSKAHQRHSDSAKKLVCVCYVSMYVTYADAISMSV